MAGPSADFTSMPPTMPPNVARTWGPAPSSTPPASKPSTMLAPSPITTIPSGPFSMSANQVPFALKTPAERNSAGKPKLKMPVSTAPGTEIGLLQFDPPMLPKVSRAELADSGQGNDSVAVESESGMPINTNSGDIGCRYLTVSVSSRPRFQPSLVCQPIGVMTSPDGSKNST
jgi:hypothetical protein